MILGAKEMGSQEEGPLDHRTGKGWVAAHGGHYGDALSKGHRVIPFIVETTGGLAPAAMAAVLHLGRRARRWDRTKYSRLRIAYNKFVPHHIQRISKAANMADAKNILKEIVTLKMRAAGIAPSNNA